MQPVLDLTTQEIRETLKRSIDVAEKDELLKLIKSYNLLVATTGKGRRIYPPVPASLRKPSDEQLAEELNEAQNDPRPPISADEVHAEMIKRFNHI